MNRAFSILDIKSVNDGERIITGMATTPSADRMGDIVEPLGVQFKNPMPLLWQHKSDKPVGLVKFDKPTKNGITFEAKLPKIDEPGVLKDRVDEAWQSVKSGLVRAVSIGFRATEHAFMDDGGIRFIETEVLELSLVTIPANAQATIHTIKCIDDELLAATGRKQNDDDRPKPAGASATKPTLVVKAQEAKRAMKKSIAEQISAFEATRQAKSARMSEIMDAAGEKGETLDEAAKQEYDGLDGEVKSIDEHLVRLRAHEVQNVNRSVEVKGGNANDASQSRGGSARVTIAAKKLPPGTMFTRYVLALARTRGDLMMAERHVASNEQWMAETPELVEILKTAVNAGTTTDTVWAGPLVNYQIMVSEFAEYLRPLTIIGRIPGLRKVPFNVKIPRQTGVATVNWVGEGKVKPLTSMAFDSITLQFAKIAGIIPLTDELVRFSNPSAEALVRDELAAAIVQFMDAQFVDPTKAANDVSPASITNGVTPVTATGTTAAAMRTDLITLTQSFLANNLSLADAVWLMTQQQALSTSLMINSLGQPLFSGVTAQGGTLLGLPVISSENIPATGGSPLDGGLIILAKAGDILLADDGQVTIDASREASLQMDTAPDSPATASTVMVSMFQQNMVAIRAERYINWGKRRSTAVAFIQNAKYAA